MLEKTTFLYEYLKLKNFSKDAFKYIESLKLSKLIINELMKMIANSNNGIYIGLTVINYESAPRLFFVNNLIMEENMKNIMDFISVVGEIDNKLDRYLKGKKIIYEKGSGVLPTDIPVTCFMDVTRLNIITSVIFTDFLYDHGLIETLNILKVKNTKDEVLNFLTQSPNNLELLQIYLPCFTSDLSLEKQKELDLEFLGYYSSKEENKIIYKVKQEGRNQFSFSKKEE